MQGVYSLLRKILKEQKSIKQEQKKQTKILQAIVSSKEKSTVFIDGKEIGEKVAKIFKEK